MGKALREEAGQQALDSQQSGAPATHHDVFARPWAWVSALTGWPSLATGDGPSPATPSPAETRKLLPLIRVGGKEALAPGSGGMALA
jgi:hypothetical protein